ncbi:hypothetical protein Tco_1000439 [Tanacetum coccineum]
MKRLFKIGRSVQVVSSEDEGLGNQEDAFKQGRKILDINVDEDITLDSTHVNTNPDMFRVHDLHGDEVFVEIEEPVVNVATTTTTTATTTVADEVEMTLAQTLIKIKSAKPKSKGVVMQGLSESTSTISSQQPLQVKGQGSKDKEAIRLQAQFDEEARVAREKEEANAVLVAQWNDIQDKQLLEKRRKFFAAKRAKEKRNRPPTKAQQRSIMCTYLKNMEGWKPKDLKTKSFANVQELFDKAMKRVNTFIDDDQQEAKLKELMEVISDEEGVAIDDIPLSTKPPSIGRIVGIKRLHGDLKVKTAQLVMLVQSYNCLFRVNAGGTKLQLLKDYNCSRIKTAEKIKIDWRSRILT